MCNQLLSHPVLSVLLLGIVIHDSSFTECHQSGLLNTAFVCSAPIDPYAVHLHDTCSCHSRSQWPEDNEIVFLHLYSVHTHLQSMPLGESLKSQHIGRNGACINRTSIEVQLERCKPKSVAICVGGQHTSRLGSSPAQHHCSSQPGSRDHCLCSR